MRFQTRGSGSATNFSLRAAPRGKRRSASAASTSPGFIVQSYCTVVALYQLPGYQIHLTLSRSRSHSAVPQDGRSNSHHLRDPKVQAQT